MFLLLKITKGVTHFSLVMSQSGRPPFVRVPLRTSIPINYGKTVRTDTVSDSRTGGDLKSVRLADTSLGGNGCGYMTPLPRFIPQS